VLIIVYATLRKPIGQPDSCAMARREWANHDETNTMVDQQSVQSELGIVSHRKNSLSVAWRGARKFGDLPKTCHLLPSTAILEP
jgi:hypothetical protein